MNIDNQDRLPESKLYLLIGGSAHGQRVRIAGTPPATYFHNHQNSTEEYRLYTYMKSADGTSDKVYAHNSQSMSEIDTHYSDLTESDPQKKET